MFILSTVDTTIVRDIPYYVSVFNHFRQQICGSTRVA